VDGDPVSELGRSELLDLYRGMVRQRTAEDRLEILHKQGHIAGGVYRGLGQEAGCVGAAYAMRRRSDGTGDVLGPHIRDLGALFLFGATPVEHYRQYMARRTGPTRGREANVHWTDFQRGIVGPVSPLGTMVGVLAGITLTFKRRGQDRAGIVFYGDGATSTGAWHEGFNFAAVQRCPLLLVVEANQWAFATPTWRQTRVGSFVEKAPGYGVGAESADGTDVLDVYRATRRALQRARAGEGAQLIELRFYRRTGHAQHDSQDYIDPEELRRWEEKDPIVTYGARLLQGGWATEEDLRAIVEDAEEEMRLAGEQAASEPQPPGDEAPLGVYTDVRARPPWTRLGEGDPRDPEGAALASSATIPR
jgi:pyruvate dehydrogenase E1 component alpha subunit/2-oxoisovalerate dehydrogenase E1 component alpha subunit